MHNRIKRLFDEGRITVDGLRTAIKYNLITEDQLREILGNRETADQSDSE